MELQRVQVNQCQFCVVWPKKVALSGTEFVECLLFSLLNVFVLASHKSVTIFIKYLSLPFYCALFCPIAISRSQSLPYKTYCL